MADQPHQQYRADDATLPTRQAITQLPRIASTCMALAQRGDDKGICDVLRRLPADAARQLARTAFGGNTVVYACARYGSVSYTHLTLPTIYSV